MAKKTPPKAKSAAAKPAAAQKPARPQAKKSSPRKAASPAAAKPAKKAPAQRTPAKRKSKEPAVLTAKTTKPRAAKAKSARAVQAAPQSAETYLAKVTHWPQDVLAGLGKMIEKAAPAKEAATESLGWLKSRATRVKEVGQKEFHELVRVAAKLKELRSTPAAAPGKRRTKRK